VNVRTGVSNATGHKAQKIRVTGYLLWDDDHNGSADVGSTIQYIGSNGFHHPWRSTAWEIHPVPKIEVIDRGGLSLEPISALALMHVAARSVNPHELAATIL